VIGTPILSPGRAKGFSLPQEGRPPNVFVILNSELLLNLNYCMYIYILLQTLSLSPPSLSLFESHYTSIPNCIEINYILKRYSNTEFKIRTNLLWRPCYSSGGQWPAWFGDKARLGGICGGESDIGIDFVRVSRFPLHIAITGRGGLWGYEMLRIG
jgi:hypothetical protein